MSETRPDDEPPRETTARETRVRDDRTIKTLSGIVALLGLWILASPFVFGSTDTAMWNNLAVGAAILLLAGYNYYRTMDDAMRSSTSVSSLVALLGLWAIAAPYLFEMGSDELFWSTLVSGLLVAALSGYNAYASRRTETARAGTRA